MADLPLKQQLGPLKVWQWLGAVTVAALAYYEWKKRQNPTAASTTSTVGSTTPVGVPPVVVNTFGGPSGATTSSPTPTQAPQPTGGTATAPYQLAVSDVADEQLAQQEGIPQSWLVYAGSDPNQSNPNAAKMGYSPPTDLPMINPSGAPAIYVGLANKVAPSGAQTLYGQNRQQTQTLLRQWTQHYVQGQG